MGEIWNKLDGTHVANKMNLTDNLSQKQLIQHSEIGLGCAVYNACIRYGYKHIYTYIYGKKYNITCIHICNVISNTYTLYIYVSDDIRQASRVHNCSLYRYNNIIGYRHSFALYLSILPPICSTHTNSFPRQYIQNHFTIAF